MRTPIRLAPATALASLALVLTVCAGCGSPAPAAPAPAGPSAVAAATPAPAQQVQIRFADGKPVGGVTQVSVALGSPVVLSVTSDVAEELHLHGYDRAADVAAGGTASISFTADLPGVFELEMEHSSTQLARIEVR